MRRAISRLVLLGVLALAGCSGGAPATPPDAGAPDAAAPRGDGPDPCHDGVKDGDETDVDCGGGCAGCGAMRACKAGADCASGICSTCGEGLRCVAAVGCSGPAAPRLDAVTPGSYTSCSCQSFVLRGASFQPGAVVVLLDLATQATSTITPLRLSDTELQVNDVCNAAAPAIGSFRLWVRNPDQLESAARDFLFTRSAPEVLTVAPSTVSRGSVFCPAFTLKATNGVCAGATWEGGACGGPNDVGTLTLTVGARPDQASTVGAQCLTIPAELTPGTYCVWVRNGDSGISDNTKTTITIN